MKRILCVMLTLIMLVSLIPAGAITASAASASVSEAAVTVLKKMTSFKSQCYKVADTNEYRIGYGTVCKEEGAHGQHTITEKKADMLLRENLAEMDKKVSSFASDNKLALKQNQHDALVVFSYGVGTAWMNGTGVIKTALVGGASASELLTAMTSVYGGLERRKIEVNMYVNGVYSNVVPSTYAQVTYDAKGGSMAQGTPYSMYFDTAVTTSHIPAPIRTSQKFLGWYLGTEWKPSLTADCADKTLEAKWQPASLSPRNASNQAVSVNYKMDSDNLASDAVYSRPDASDDYLLDVDVPDTITVVREYIGDDGARWAMFNGRNNSVRWVMVRAGSNGAPSAGGNTQAAIDVTVTVTNSYVNYRRNPSITSTKLGTFYQGKQLRIINTANADGYQWGQVATSATDNTSVGWVALMYTNWNDVKNNAENKPVNGNAIALATITYSGYVNLRSGAGTDSGIVGSLANNETVEIYEIQTVNGHQWGRTNGGWFCLTYASLVMMDGNVNQDVSSEGALTYTFHGKTAADIVPLVSPSDGADQLERYYYIEGNRHNNRNRVDLWPAKGKDINVSNMVVARDGSLWVKISWRVDLNRDGAEDTTKYGWVKMAGDLSTTSSPVTMDPVKFTVVSDELTVRTAAGNGEASVCKLNKGVEVEIQWIKLVGENIWGWLSNEHVVVGDNGIDGSKTFDGWINLATKYVKRSTLPTIEGDTSLTPIGKTATVVNTDSVNVRINGTIYDKIIGKLTRGTTANILEVSKNGDWYNLDVDVDHNPKTGSWVHKQYLEIRDGTVGGTNNGSGSGSSSNPVITGKGVVANTYSGVNVRTGAGQSYPMVGKLLPGTLIDILEVKTVGAAKWARFDKGWVCMDYITMLSENVTYPGVTDGSNGNNGSTNVGSWDEIDKTTTTAVYTGVLKDNTKIYANTEHHGKNPDEDNGSFVVREAGKNEHVTIYELIAVTEKIENTDSNPDTGHGSTVETVVTSYWARVNDGYIWNPQDYIQLDALDEKVHTLTGADTLRVRQTANGAEFEPKLNLEKGDQVKVTALEIKYDKVWGRIEYEGHTGWIRLDYMAEGAYSVQKPAEPQAPAPTDPTYGIGSNNGGFVNNAGGYRYTGKVINTNELNVRATASQTATKTTTLKSGASLVIYETTIAENMAWGRCDAGWVYLYYVDLTPCVSGAVDARVVYTDNTVIYTDSSCSSVTGSTYARMSVIDIYEIVGKMARTDQGWVSTNDLL